MTKKGPHFCQISENPVFLVHHVLIIYSTIKTAYFTCKFWPKLIVMLSKKNAALQALSVVFIFHLSIYVYIYIYIYICI